VSGTAARYIQIQFKTGSRYTQVRVCYATVIKKFDTLKVHGIMFTAHSTRIAHYMAQM